MDARVENGFFYSLVSPHEQGSQHCGLHNHRPVRRARVVCAGLRDRLCSHLLSGSLPLLRGAFRRTAFSAAVGLEARADNQRHLPGAARHILPHYGVLWPVHPSCETVGRIRNSRFCGELCATLAGDGYRQACTRGGAMTGNKSIDTDPQPQEAASPRMLVVRSFLRLVAS